MAVYNRRVPSWTVPPDSAGIRLDKFLAAPDRLGSRGRAADALEKDKVFLNGAEVGRAQAARRLRAGDEVRVWLDRPGTARGRPVARAGDLEILFEDKSLIVVNKPAGLLAVPLARRSDAPSAYDCLDNHLRPRGRRRPLVVHRIDRDTSGLVVFAKDVRAQQALKAQFRRRTPERVYRAVLYGHPQPPQGTWRDRLVWDAGALLQKRAHPDEARATTAISHYRVLETLAGASLVEIRLETGKRNQIRVQARLHGHMLVGERLYVRRGAERPIDFPRQALHAYRLSFEHPADGRPLTFEAPMPDDLEALLARLRAPSDTRI